MAPNYAPLTLGARMSDYGYWVVTVSVAPGLRLEVMICKVGITQQQALDAVNPVVPRYPAVIRR